MTYNPISRRYRLVGDDVDVNYLVAFAQRLNGRDTTMTRNRLQAVFFDLDGTLADTAADLAAPVNAMRVERGLAPLPLGGSCGRFASTGARGLIGSRDSASTQDDPRSSRCATSFSRATRARCACTRVCSTASRRSSTRSTRARVDWGVVSNKVERYVRPIIGASRRARSRRDARSAATPRAFTKPHPEPLLHARAAGRASTRPPASTSATTCATSRPAAPPACARWPRPTASAARLAPRPVGRRPPDRAAARVARPARLALTRSRRRRPPFHRKRSSSLRLARSSASMSRTRYWMPWRVGDQQRDRDSRRIASSPVSTKRVSPRSVSTSQVQGVTKPDTSSDARGSRA